MKQKQQIIQASVDWDYFNKFEDIIDTYMPRMGEGDTVASQCVTAVNKLIYKWYNDGDVFDNTYSLRGWMNDLSSYANWLAKYIPGTKRILSGIAGCDTDDDYEQLLKYLADTLLDEDKLQQFAEQPATGSIYKCDGPYKVEDYDEDEYDDDDYYYDEDEDEEDY